MNTIKVGIIGCGNISSIYFKNCHTLNHIELVACADISLERAQAQANKFGIEKAYTVDEILDDPSVELIINLTIPKAHADVCLKALNAGKHVYTEKPFTVRTDEANAILQKAKEKGLLVGSAPDTFLGAGIQTAIQVIERGEIGTPIGASAFMIGRGHEHWHPDPAFYYDEGGGPMFDMGPYYLTALTALLGPMKKIAGSARISYPVRTILSEPKAGEKVTVMTPTHLSGVIDFASGAMATLTTSFDAFGGSTLPPIEIYGSEGTMLVPDPNTFSGVVKVRKRDEQDFKEIAHTHQLVENSRGIGVADMANAILTGQPHRASGELAYHVLEAMHGFHISSENETHYKMKSTCKKPKPFPQDLTFF
ncbi:Gfo/Idh/MocA family protein [Halalkalibacter sp. APA_J-10(15)]|uniref:Gfo/Idh/MocA family protein n=1 Tax=unclassified Halalkalibacter TaxID=2893063 RepID=UPI001FF1027B|nr:Gfo/Idh/MocA family oxidoreductase [Halalkalibacter sp. APA_J-10(15)]MCK0472234.1 Gfo/Idh/MocA family oxidoreductase [Halalkalibacter sp. APA_J-10(15)]